MDRLPLLFALMFLPASAGVQAAAPAPTIPAKFRGEWAAVPGDCSKNGGDNTRGFTITARAITHYEESEEIATVKLLGSNAFSYTGKWVFEDGDEPAAGKLSLSPDGRKLDTGKAVLIRC